MQTELHFQIPGGPQHKTQFHACLHLGHSCSTLERLTLYHADCYDQLLQIQRPGLQDAVLLARNTIGMLSVSLWKTEMEGVTH